MGARTESWWPPGEMSGPQRRGVRRWHDDGAAGIAKKSQCMATVKAPAEVRSSKVVLQLRLTRTFFTPSARQSTQHTVAPQHHTQGARNIASRTRYAAQTRGVAVGPEAQREPTMSQHRKACCCQQQKARSHSPARRQRSRASRTGGSPRLPGTGTLWLRGAWNYRGVNSGKTQALSRRFVDVL